MAHFTVSMKKLHHRKVMQFKVSFFEYLPAAGRTAASAAATAEASASSAASTAAENQQQQDAREKAAQ